MTEFAPNGAVIASTDRAETDFARRNRERETKVRRVGLACFLCAISASVLVSAFGILAAIILTNGFRGGDITSDAGFAAGAMLGAFMAAGNWVMFYVTIPLSWIAIGLSIGRFPEKRIRETGAYLRRGVILGAATVGIVCSLLVPLVALSGSSSLNSALPLALGGLFMGSLIGAAAGYCCAGLFTLIVRPKSQIPAIDALVF